MQLWYNPYYRPPKRLEFREGTREIANVNYHDSIEKGHQESTV